MTAPHLLALRPFLRFGDFAPGNRGHGVVEVLAPHVHVCVDKVAYPAFVRWGLQRLDPGATEAARGQSASHRHRLAVTFERFVTRCWLTAGCISRVDSCR